jgi:ferredoxin
MSNSTHPADDPDSGYLLIGAGGGKALLFHSGKCTICENCIAVCPHGVFFITFRLWEKRVGSNTK